MLRLSADIPDDLADQADRWLKRAVGCLFGRVHCRKDRFALASVSSAADLSGVHEAFGAAIRTQGALSCLVLIEPGNDALPSMTIEQLVRYLDRKFFTATDSRRRDIPLVSGAAYSISYTITCPVAGVPVSFTDFDQVAFYPQAADEADPLYDPSMFAPFVCINITSDSYAFALTCADRKEVFTDKPFREMSAAGRSEVYEAALKMFQRLAEQSIVQYRKATNPAAADPIDLSDDRRYYIAPHDEAAFAETAKKQFRSEMPVLYAPRIVEEWEKYFATGATPDMTNVYLPAIPVER